MLVKQPTSGVIIPVLEHGNIKTVQYWEWRTGCYCIFTIPYSLIYSCQLSTANCLLI